MSDMVWVHPFGEAGLNRVGKRLRVLWEDTRRGVRDEGARPRYRAFETRGALKLLFSNNEIVEYTTGMVASEDEAEILSANPEGSMITAFAATPHKHSGAPRRLGLQTSPLTRSCNAFLLLFLTLPSVNLDSRFEHSRKPLAQLWSTYSRSVTSHLRLAVRQDHRSILP